MPVDAARLVRAARVFAGGEAAGAAGVAGAAGEAGVGAALLSGLAGVLVLRAADAPLFTPP